MHIAVILSGNGYLDGSETQEAVLSLLAIEKLGYTWDAFAPDKQQLDVIDHIQQEPVLNQERNCLHEAGRITRGAVAPLIDCDPYHYDAIWLPGGFGAAKNLSTFALTGTGADLDPEVARVLTIAHTEEKPIVALCMAPAVVALVLAKADVHGAQLTIGNDPSTAAALRDLGVQHVSVDWNDCVVDEQHRLISCPCYMFDARISEVAAGIDQAAQALRHMLQG
jgi:enhancing lycopene biosynthesis protein 2